MKKGLVLEGGGSRGVFTSGVLDYLQEQGVKSVLLPALEYMRTDSNGEPDTAFLKARLSEMLDEHRDAEIYITQGYICKNAYG